jgi:hypothetical protein
MNLTPERSLRAWQCAGWSSTASDKGFARLIAQRFSVRESSGETEEGKEKENSDDLDAQKLELVNKVAIQIPVVRRTKRKVHQQHMVLNIKMTGGAHRMQIRWRFDGYTDLRQHSWWLKMEISEKKSQTSETLKSSGFMIPDVKMIVRTSTIQKWWNSDEIRVRDEDTARRA